MTSTPKTKSAASRPRDVTPATGQSETTGQPASLVGQAEAGGGVSPPPADEPKPGPTLIVKGPARGRWRIGRHFTAEPVTIRLDELSDDEALRLAADPELTIVPVNAPY